MDILRKLVHIRKSLGISVHELGRMLSLTGETVWYRETRANKTPDLDELARWADVLGYRLDVKLVKKQKVRNG